MVDDRAVTLTIMQQQLAAAGGLLAKNENVQSPQRNAYALFASFLAPEPNMTESARLASTVASRGSRMAVPVIECAALVAQWARARLWGRALPGHDGRATYGIGRLTPSHARSGFVFRGCIEDADRSYVVFVLPAPLSPIHASCISTSKFPRYLFLIPHSSLPLPTTKLPSL